MDSVRTVRSNRAVAREVAQNIILHLLIAVAAALVGFPFFYMVGSSLKTLGEVYSVSLSLWPRVPQWHNYVVAWTSVPFARFTLNSIVFATAITVAKFSMGLTAGFAFGRLHFPKKEWLFFFILITFMMPSQITLVPRFMLLRDLRWINTYQGMVIPEFSSAFVTFLLHQHFKSLPDELFDAAKIDGAGYVRQMLQVAVPVSKPIISTLLLLTFVAAWNEYLWPMVVTNTLEMRTLPIGLQFLKTLNEVPQWHIVCAGAVIVVAPLMALYVVTQRQFIEGAIQGALKG